jgi:hypothetical protein
MCLHLGAASQPYPRKRENGVNVLTGSPGGEERAAGRWRTAAESPVDGTGSPVSETQGGRRIGRADRRARLSYSFVGGASRCNSSRKLNVNTIVSCLTTADVSAAGASAKRRPSG